MKPPGQWAGRGVFTISFIFILTSKTEFSPFFIVLLCSAKSWLLNASGTPPSKLASLGPCLLYPLCANTGCQGRYLSLGHTVAWVRSQGFSFQTGLSPGNDTSFLLTF